MEPLSQSTDLTPLENMWREFKLRIKKINQTNVTDLKIVCQEEWDK